MWRFRGYDGRRGRASVVAAARVKVLQGVQASAAGKLYTHSPGRGGESGNGSGSDMSVEIHEDFGSSFPCLLLCPASENSADTLDPWIASLGSPTSCTPLDPRRRRRRPSPPPPPPPPLSVSTGSRRA